MLYTHIQIHAEHNNTMKTTSDASLEKYTSHFIWKGSKGWEGVGDRTELQHIDPHSYGHERCAFLVLQGCSTRGLGAQLSAECWLSLPHLVTNFWSPKLTGGSWGSLLLGGGFLYHIFAPTSGLQN